MDTQKIVKALASDASDTFVFDVTTGVIEKDIISSDGTNYTQLAGLSSPCSFNDLIDIYFIKEKKCRILSDDKKQSLSREFLIDSYFSGKIRLEINIFYKITNAYYRILYFLYEDNDSGHVFAFVVCRLINEVENEVFTTNGNKKSKLQEEKETFYKNMMDIQSCGVLAYTFPGYQIVNANAETLRMFGYKSIDDMQSKLYDIIAAVHYTSSDTLEKLKNLRKEDGTVDHEFILNKGEENECYVIAKTKIIYSPNGKRIIYSTYVDASEMHALKTVLEKAEAGNKAKSAFLFNMSHDLRTPMNAIIGFTNIALKKETKPEVRDCLKKIGDSSEHLLTLINDVLDISRIESGKTKFNPTPVDIAVVADMVMDIMCGFLVNRNITFNVRREKPENPYVLADAVRIREVLVNILGNAVKFTDDGGSITFESTYHPGEDDRHIMVRYRITDTGVGMSEEFVKHIFDEFAQEESGARTHYKGTGLGMAITKRYVDLMNGIISVESKKGEGSTFIVELPLELTDESKVQKQDTSVASVSMKGIKVLMAEDNDLNAEIAMVQLEEMGMTVTRVADGREAVELFRDSNVGTFDIILMDIMMPKMNGYEATCAIRELQDHPEADTIPIIAMTANAFAEDIQASLDAGMNGHLSKPIVVEEVVKTIARNLRK